MMRAFVLAVIVLLVLITVGLTGWSVNQQNQSRLQLEHVATAQAEVLRQRDQLDKL